MAEYQGEYGHPYPRVDQYGNPVPPVDQYGNPVPREPPAASGLLAGGGTAASAAPLYGDTAGAGYVAAAPGEYPGGGVAPGEPALAYEGMVGGAGAGVGIDGAMAGVRGQLQPTRKEEEITFGSSQLQPTAGKEQHKTLGEKLTRSGSSSSSSSSEDDGQGGRRKKKSIKQKIKEKLPGAHKHEEHKAGGGHTATATAGTTHAAGAHEKKGFMDKIKEKLPGHH